MASKRAKWLVALLLGLLTIMGAIYGYLARSAGEPVAVHPFFTQGTTPRPLVIAHRGGAGLWPENTLYAFEHAAELGVDCLELDVRSTSDGVLVVMHDAGVERTTDGAGRVNSMTLAELKGLDAGYDWTPDGGRSFPMRGRGITVPTLEEVFTALPRMRFIMEPKQDAPSITRPLCRMIEEHAMTDRLVVGSFNQTVIDEFRRECPAVATSASTSEASKFLSMYKTGVGRAYSPTMQALQVPEYFGGMEVVSRGFVETAHQLNLQVHVWTVNNPANMQRLLEMGVDGIMTDYPDRLMQLVGRAPTPAP